MNQLANKILKIFKKTKKQKILYKKGNENIKKIFPVKQNEIKIPKRTSINEGLKKIFEFVRG